jgi:hypothetical protein
LHDAPVRDQFHVAAFNLPAEQFERAAWPWVDFDNSLSAASSLTTLRRRVGGRTFLRIAISQRYPLRGNDVRFSPVRNSAFKASCRDLCIDARLRYRVLATGNHPGLDDG